MTYNLDAYNNLVFLESAKKEWHKLVPNIKELFKKKLAQRLQQPCIPKDQLIGLNKLLQNQT